MISKDKTYRTRGGQEVRIYATDGGGSHAVHGSVKMNDGWRCTTWRADGLVIAKEEHCADLIEVKPRHKRTVWLNVFEGDGGVGAFTMKEAADSFNSRRRIACIRVDLDFEEGEGL